MSMYLDLWILYTMIIFLFLNLLKNPTPGENNYNPIRTEVLPGKLRLGPLLNIYIPRSENSKIGKNNCTFMKYLKGAR